MPTWSLWPRPVVVQKSRCRSPSSRPCRATCTEPRTVTLPQLHSNVSANAPVGSVPLLSPPWGSTISVCPSRPPDPPSLARRSCLVSSPAEWSQADGRSCSNRPEHSTVDARRGLRGFNGSRCQRRRYSLSVATHRLAEANAAAAAQGAGFAGNDDQNFQKPNVDRPVPTWSLWPRPVVVQNTTGKPGLQFMYCTQLMVTPADILMSGPGS